MLDFWEGVSYFFVDDSGGRMCRTEPLGVGGGKCTLNVLWVRGELFTSSQMVWLKAWDDFTSSKRFTIISSLKKSM